MRRETKLAQAMMGHPLMANFGLWLGDPDQPVTESHVAIVACVLGFHGDGCRHWYDTRGLPPGVS